MVVVFIRGGGACVGQSLDDLPPPDPSFIPRQRREPKPQNDDPAGAAGPREPAPVEPASVPLAPRDAPPRADIEIATKAIRELYEQDIRRAGQPQQRPQVVRMFLELAKDKTLTAAESYAILVLSNEIAGQGDDLGLFEESLRAFTAAFLGVDGDAKLLAYLTERDRASIKLTGDHVVAVMGVNQRCRRAERYEAAEEAADLAARMLKKVDGVTAARLRDRLADLATMTASEADIAASARAARDVLAKDPADGMANLQVGQHAVIRGEWPLACQHLRLGGREDFRKAAEAEPAAASDPGPLCAAADAWWNIVASDPAAVPDAAGAVGPPLPPPVLRAVRAHAVDLYTRALDRDLDKHHALSAKRARNRVAEVRDADHQREDPIRHDEVVPPDAPAVFDAREFGRVEGQRMNAWRRFQDAVRNGDRRAHDAAAAELTRIRPQWCRLLDPAVRNATLPERRRALQQIIDQDKRCADAHLCMSYLHALDGAAEDATGSLNECLRLLDREQAAQVFCARQLLDVAWAAVTLGDIETAKSINTVLQRRFPNDPAVLQVQALLWIEQPQPRFRDAIDKLEDAYAKTKGEDRAMVAARLAWLLAAVPRNTNLRMPADADRMADEAIRTLDGRSWWAWRAKAELRASENKWDEAIDLLGRAMAQAPGIVLEEISRQQDCYRGKKPFEIDRKNK